MRPRDFVEIKIIDALSEKDQSCPVCRLINESVEKLVDTILYELVNDPQIRSNLRTMGLCKQHAEMIERYLQQHPELGLLGIAIIYEDMLGHELRTLRQPSVEGVGNCYLCDRQTQIEKTYTSSFGRIFSEPQGVELFLQSEAVFCLDHFRKTYQLVDNSMKDRFEEIQVRKLSYLKNQLSIFIEKHDYRNKKPFGKEANVYKLVGRLIAKPVSLDNRRNHKWQIWKNSKER
ncbi:MAG TPA: DUF6062 family protein [Pseudothermotoga sp.]|nr:DUF6062 family protein [Pseudothermotoga sp.]HOK84022.1 DUF6062 family protein [Pseudothermotoga sp.]HPP70488.1 DUF6062 family protein [Pseudothermotoga sp.]